jgi:hypothetical protein
LETYQQQAEVEYELNRNRIMEENEKRLALLRQKGAALREICEMKLQRSLGCVCMKFGLNVCQDIGSSKHAELFLKKLLNFFL